MDEIKYRNRFHKGRTRREDHLQHPTDLPVLKVVNLSGKG
jgi:hypothetical protein